MSPKLPEDYEAGRRELQVTDGDTAAALETLKPLLRPEKMNEARVVVARMVSKSHSGPIPSAEELEHLESVLAGSANRCFEMAEREQIFRHGIQNNIVTKEFLLRGRGQMLAMAGLILLLAVVCYLGYLGDTQAAAWLGGATIVGVVSLFVSGKLLEEKGESEPAEEKPRPKNTPARQQVSSQSRRKRGSTKR